MTARIMDAFVPIGKEQEGLLMEAGLIETRDLNGYLFKVYDADWGYYVEVWRDGVKLNARFVLCIRINCILTDDELMAVVP